MSDGTWTTVIDPRIGPKLPQRPSDAIKEFLGQPRIAAPGATAPEPETFVPTDDDGWDTIAIPAYWQTALGKANLVDGVFEGEDFSIPVADMPDAGPVYSRGPKPDVSHAPSAGPATSPPTDDPLYRFEMNRRAAAEVNSLGRVLAQPLASAATGAMGYDAEAANRALNEKLRDLEIEYQAMRPWTEAPDALAAAKEFLIASAGTIVGSVQDPTTFLGGTGKNVIQTGIRGAAVNAPADIATQLSNIEAGIQSELNPNGEVWDPTRQEFVAGGPTYVPRDYDPAQTAGAAALGFALPVGLEAALRPEARAEIGALFRAGLERLRAAGRRPAAGPPTPEETAIVMRDPAIQAVLDASGETTSPEVADAFAARIGARRAAEAERPAQPVAPDLVAPRDIFADIEATRAQEEGVSAGEIARQFAPRAPAFRTPEAITVDPSAVARPAQLTQDVMGRPRARAVDQPDLEAATTLRTGEYKLPVPVEPRQEPMTDDAVAIARKFMARGPAKPDDTPGRLLGGEDRLPTTPEGLEGQRQAAEAFRLADRQRERVDAAEVPRDVRDTQAAGLPKGVEPKEVFLDEGNPVRVIEVRKMRNQAGVEVDMAKVRRYDPRTDEFEADSIDYLVPAYQLKRGKYTPEPRRAQDFSTRAEGPRQPELPRAEHEPPRLEPKQTFRRTQPDPNERFPAAGEGRSPLPPQPEPTGRPRYSSAEEAMRDFRERARADRADSEAREARAGERYRDTKHSNAPKGQDDAKRWHVDEDGYVLSTKGGPVKFADQKQAAKWIINEGQKKSPDQNFEISNHPSGSGFTAREHSRTPHQAEPKQKGMGGAERGQAGPRSEESFKREAGTPEDTTTPQLRGRDDKPRSADTAEGAADRGSESGDGGGGARVGEKDAGGADVGAKETIDLSSGKTFKADVDLNKAYAEFQAKADEDIDAYTAARDALDDKIRAKYPGITEVEVMLARMILSDAFDDAAAKTSKGGTVFRSGFALTPEELKAFVKRAGELLFGGRREWAQHLAETSRIVHDIGKPRAALKSLLRGTASIAKSIFYSADGYVRSLARVFKSDTMREMADFFHATAGEGKRAIAETYDEAVTKKVTTTMNDLSKALEPFLSDTAALEQITRMVQSGSINERTPMGAAAAAIRKMLKDELAYLKAAGVDIGEVRTGFFPREIDEMAALRDPKGFVKVYAQAYRQYQGLDAKAALAAAETLLDTILMGGEGGNILRGQGAGIRPNFTEGRVFPKAADNLLRPFLMQDPTRVLSSYFHRSAKRAEAARRFGDQWEKWSEMEHKVREEVGAENAQYAIDAARSLAMSATGMRAEHVNAHLVTASSWARTWAVLAYLSKVTVSSLQEAVMPGVRSGSTFDSMRSLLETGVQIGMAIGGHKSKLVEMAEDLGIIHSYLGQSVHVQRFFGDNPSSYLQEKAMRTFFRNTGLEQYTNITRAIAMGTAQTFIRRMAKKVDSAFSKTHLRELGIPDEKAPAFAKWLSSFKDGLPDAVDLKGTKQPEMANLYRTALMRFVDQSIMRPSAATKPGWATHPLGAIAFQLNSFNMAFGKNVLARGVRRLTQAVTDDELSAIERAKLATSMLAPLALLAAVGTGISMKRDQIYGTERRKGSKKQEAEEVLGGLTTRGELLDFTRHASRVGAFGGADPWVNFFTQARYDKDPLSAVTGPVVGGAIETVATVPDAIWKNSPNTNTAERKIARQVWDKVMEPGANLLINTLLPPSLFSAAAIQGLSAPELREDFVTGVAGKEKRDTASKDKQSSVSVKSSSGRQYAVSKGKDGRTIVEVMEG